MSDGQKVGIILLDDSSLEIPVQPRLTSNELRDLVASHANLRERDYFGLAFKDDNGNWSWLHADRKVLEHDFSKTQGKLTLYFSVQFYVESIQYLSDSNTYEQFYLQARRLLFKGALECDSESHFRLTALVLQIIYGDYSNDATTRKQLKFLNAFPTRIFEIHPSLEYCETQVLQFYRAAAGLEKGEAILEFLSLLESVPLYGIHFYEVKDKTDTHWWLGVSHKGLSQHDYRNKSEPRKSYPWTKLGDVTCRGQKVNVELLGSNSRVSPIGRRSVSSTTLSWNAFSTHRARIICNIANAHGKFFGRRRRASQPDWTSFRDQSTVAYDLTHRRHSFSRLPSMQVARSRLKAHRSSGNLGRAELVAYDHLHRGTPNHDDENPVELSPEEAKAKMKELMKGKADVTRRLIEKETELLQLMCDEFELTGVMPDDYQEVAFKGEKRRLKQTSFILSPNLVKKISTSSAQPSLDQEIVHLEMEKAVLSNILEANKQKAQETKKKAYKIACKDCAEKLQHVEARIQQLRSLAGDSMGSCVQFSTLSLASLSDSGRTADSTSLGATHTDDTPSDSASLYSSSAASIDVGRRFSESCLVDLPRSDGQIHICDSQHSLSPSTESVAMQQLTSYLAHCPSPAYSARLRYRTLMHSHLGGSMSSDISQPVYLNSSPSSPEVRTNSPQCAFLHDQSTLKRDVEPASPVRKKAVVGLPPKVRALSPGNSDIADGGDSGFVSLHQGDLSPSSSSNLRRHSSCATNSPFNVTEIEAEDQLVTNVRECRSRSDHGHGFYRSSSAGLSVSHNDLEIPSFGKTELENGAPSVEPHHHVHKRQFFPKLKSQLKPALRFDRIMKSSNTTNGSKK